MLECEKMRDVIKSEPYRNDGYLSNNILSIEIADHTSKMGLNAIAILHDVRTSMPPPV